MTQTPSGDRALHTTGAAPRRPLRVCHVAYTFYENDNRVIRYAETLAARGDEVEVIALRRTGQPTRGEADGVRVLRIQRRNVNERRAVAYLAKLLWFLVKASAVVSLRQLRSRYDVVHVHNVPDFLVFAAWLPRVMGARVILDIHDILPELYAGKFATGGESALFRALLRVERLSCRFAHHVIVANHLWFETLTRRAVPAGRCTAILNYPDLERFQRRRTPRSSGPFLFLYPGTLNHHQGLDLAIQAFALGRDRMPDAQFDIYGEGPARPELERQVADLGLQEAVRVRPRVPFDAVAGLMQDADAGVVPKRADGFGNEAFSTKTLEFMACGVPVIVARTRVDAYYFTDRLVRFFTPGDAADLAEAMVRVYEQRDRFAEWVSAARAFAEEFGWQRRRDDYLNLVDRGLMPSMAGDSVRLGVR